MGHYSEPISIRDENALSQLKMITRSEYLSLKAQIPDMTKEKSSYLESNLRDRKSDFEIEVKSFVRHPEYLRESALYRKYMDELIDEIRNKTSNDPFQLVREIEFKLEDGSTTENSIDFDLINARLKELGYVDGNMKATDRFSNRFIAHFKRVLDSELVYEWPSNVETIRDRIYFICSYYDRKFELGNGNVHGSYRNNDLRPHLSNLSFVFEGMYVFQEVQ